MSRFVLQEVYIREIYYFSSVCVLINVFENVEVKVIVQKNSKGLESFFSINKIKNNILKCVSSIQLMFTSIIVVW